MPHATPLPSGGDLVAAGRQPYLRRFHHQPPAGLGTLVCLPHAGGAAGYFHPLSRVLCGAVQVRAVQYPGRQDRRKEPFAPSVEWLADRIAEELAADEFLYEEPVFLFGHSMGACVAFEVALRIEARRPGAVGLLVASGRRAPSIRRRDILHGDQLDDETLLADLRQLSGTDERVLADPELMRRTLPVIRGDYETVSGYDGAGRTVTCPIEVLAGRDDPLIAESEAFGWGRHTTSSCRVTFPPGGHFYLDHNREVVTSTILRWMSP